MIQDVVEGLQAVTQGFGCVSYGGEWYVDWCPDHRFHSGIDLAAALGQPVHTTRSGVVTAVGIQYLGPCAVGIRTDEAGLFLVFGHLDSNAVKVGDRVTAGQVIGRCGTKGNSSGPHVHFAVRRDAATEDVNRYQPDVYPTSSTGRILDPTPYLTIKAAPPALLEDEMLYVMTLPIKGGGTAQFLTNLLRHRHIGSAKEVDDLTKPGSPGAKAGVEIWAGGAVVGDPAVAGNPDDAATAALRGLPFP